MTYTNLNIKQIFLTSHSMILPCNTGKHAQMVAENRKGMKGVGTSSVSHVSRKPLQCIGVTTPIAGHVVEVTFRNHCNAYDLFSNATPLSSSLFNGGNNNVIF